MHVPPTSLKKKTKINFGSGNLFKHGAMATTIRHCVSFLESSNGKSKLRFRYTKEEYQLYTDVKKLVFQKS
jgi:hypothetical protein